MFLYLIFKTNHFLTKKPALSDDKLQQTAMCPNISTFTNYAGCA